MRAFLMTVCCFGIATSVAAQDVPPITLGPVTLAGSLRTRVETWNWFGTAPGSDYTYNGSILRAALSQARKNVAWQLEFAAPILLGLPDDAVAPAPAATLGLGGNYFAANDNRTNVGALFVKQAFVTFTSSRSGQSLRVGRMEFADGAETVPKPPALVIVKRDRIAQRLLGSFTFTHVGRSFDGARYVLNKSTFNVTGLVARATRGVFDVDGWSELQANVFYAALTRPIGTNVTGGEWRVFGLGYQDYRQRQHINIGTFGGHYLQAIATGAGTLDLLAWGALQSGSWRSETHRAGAGAIEGGVQPHVLPRLAPWIRAGYNVGSGDDNAADARHGTFFQVLPTPRLYARFPFFNLMNVRDLFGSLMVRPGQRVTARGDVHSLRLDAARDTWYQGGGAFEPNTFGYAARPSNGRTSLATLSDVSVDVTISRRLTVGGYVGHAAGGDVPAAIYPSDRSATFGYVEALIRF